MNIKEAIDTNTLLRWMLRLSDAPAVREVDARDAAGRLADRASGALHAGLTAAKVLDAWRSARVRRATPPRDPKPPGPKKKPDGGPAR